MSLSSSYLVHFWLYDIRVLIDNMFLHELHGFEKLFAFLAPPLSFFLLEYIIGGHRGSFT
jgi:hypothetical protein